MMHDNATRRALAYVLAVLAVAGAILLRWLLDPLLGSHLPLTTLYGTVAIAVWYGGYRPALLAASLGYLGADILFIEPRGTLTFRGADQVLGLVLYLLSCLLIIALGEAMRTARRRAEASRQDILDKNKQLELEAAIRQQAVEELRQRVEENDKLMELLPLGVFIAHDPACRRITGNRAGYALLRLPVGSNLSVTPPPGEQPPFTARRDGRPLAEDELPIQHAAAHAVDVRDVEVEHVYPDGTTYTLFGSASPLFDAQGKVRGCVASFLDITERKRMETALRKQNERLRLLWEAAAVLLSTNEPDAMLRGLFAGIASHFALDVYLNYALNETGDALRLESYSGIPDETARVISRLEFGQALCGTAALTRQPVVANRVQESDDPKTQRIKALGVRACACNPLLAGDRLLGTLLFASRSRDEFDPEELDFLQTICHYVTAAYERLRLIRQLQEADRRKDEFLAMLAHELRNPLAPLRNAVGALRLLGPTDLNLQRARDMIERQVLHLTRLVDDLLDVSRITRGKVTLHRESLDLLAVVAGSVETSRPLIEARRHELTVTLPPQPVRVQGDAIRLAQVFANLLNNAAKYTPDGGQIGLTVETAAGEAVVRVRDNGVGIAADLLPHVFDLFTQGDRSLARSEGGLGIGLSMVKRLVELHGGSVQARSDGPGRGSELIVRLPTVRSQEPGARGQGPASSSLAPDSCPPAPGRRVLVVDDNTDAADSLALLLRLSGHDVRTVHDGPTALEVAEAFRPEVVLLDIGLPRMDGYEVARRLRQRDGAKRVLLVAVTGYGQEEDRRRTAEAGFDAHLVKPAEPVAVQRLLAGAARLAPSVC